MRRYSIWLCESKVLTHNIGGVACGNVIMQSLPFSLSWLCFSYCNWLLIWTKIVCSTNMNIILMPGLHYTTFRGFPTEPKWVLGRTKKGSLLWGQPNEQNPLATTETQSHFRLRTPASLCLTKQYSVCVCMCAFTCARERERNWTHFIILKMNFSCVPKMNQGLSITDIYSR